MAVPRPDGSTAEELVRNADVAMYAAKAEGKDRFARYEEGMLAAVQQRVRTRQELAAALEAGDQLELHYQPIVRLHTGEAVGVEALVRWRHPENGLVSPAEFIPVAEETGLVVDLGRFVLYEATAQIARWQARHPALATMSLSVNASGRQLADDHFVEDVRAALVASGLAPELLVVEITESVLLRDEDAVLSRLEALKALGVRLAIDDFGAGYASLGYLRRYPVDVLKVDLSFTSDLATAGRPGALAEAVVRIGAALDLETIAEGVEHGRQVEALQALSCEYGQGYLFARPLPPADCEALLLGRGPLVPAG